MAGSERTPTLSSSHGSNGGSIDRDLPVLASSLRSTADFGFTGTFISDDTTIAGSLQIRPDRVIMWAGGSQLASWDLTECRIERLTASRFAVHADEETLTFTADDATGLQAAISDLWSRGESSAFKRPMSDTTTGSPRHNRMPETVKPAAPKSPEARRPPVEQPQDSDSETTDASPTALRRESQPPVNRRARIKNFQIARTGSDSGETEVSRVPTVQPVEELVVETPPSTIADQVVSVAATKTLRAARWLRSDIKDIGVKVAAVALASILLGGFAYSIYVLAGGTGYEPEVFVEDPTTSIPPRPSTTVPSSPVVTVPVPPTTLFDTDLAQLTDRWNLIAEASRPELILIRDLTSPLLVSLTPFMTLEGVLDPNAGYLTLRSTPTATPEGDGAILSSLGMMVAMSDPSLEPVDRRLLLEALGLDVRDPDLSGIDASLNYNGLNYRLTYFQDQNVLEFAITPEVPVTTTTAAP